MSEKPNIEIVTPQFDREDGVEVQVPADFSDLRKASAEELEELGCRLWSEESGLYLFPAEWYGHIPPLYKVRTINGKTKRFVPGVSDDDRRFGVLPYGVVAHE